MTRMSRAMMRGIPKFHKRDVFLISRIQRNEPENEIIPINEGKILA